MRRIEIKAHDILEAVGLLTRLPVRLRAEPAGAKAAWAYPLVGLIVGGLATLVAWLAAGPAPAAVAAGLALATTIIVTGALHEDGLADTADGLWGGWTPARRLDIMRDSRIGTYGVLALVLSVGLRWTALTELAAAGEIARALIATAVLSRLPMVWLMAALPHARTDGLSRLTGRPSVSLAGLATLLALGIGLAVLGAATIPVALCMVAASLLLAALTRVKIGGQTGDVLGAMQQVSEIVILVILSALLV